MKISHFIGVLVLTLIALALGSTMLSSQKGEQSFEQTQFIKDFDFDTVYQVKLQDSNNEVTLNKQLEQWQLVQAHGYQPDLKVLARLLQQLKDAQIQELKTSNSKNYHRLGLAGIKQEGSSSLLITLVSPDKKLELLLGDNAKAGSGQYAKMTSEQQTYLLDQSFDISANVKSWLQKAIFEIAFDSVRKLIWQDSQSSFTVTRKELEATGEVIDDNGNPSLPKGEASLSRDFELTEPKQSKTPIYPSIYSGLVRNTIQLELQDVLPATDFEAKQLEANFTIQLAVKENATIEHKKLHFYQGEQEQYWLKVDSRNWVYQISEFSYSQLAKPLAEYLEE